MLTQEQENRKRELEQTCMECQEEFFSMNYGKSFNYSKCKRCKDGVELHELENHAWIANYVKRDV